MTNAKFTTQQVFAIKQHSNKFISFKISKPPQFSFKAGQFARLALTQKDGSQIWRAYSMLNPPSTDFLEFFAIIVPGGKFSSLLTELKNGDEILLAREVFGFLTLDRFSDGQDLWLLATGTGVAPFLSILQETQVWQQFKRINLVYSVRYQADLAYQDLIQQLQAQNSSQFTYLPIISGENITNMLNGRITTLLQNNALEQAANCALTLDNSRLMLCGNPQMVQDCLKILKERSFSLALRRNPGQIALENYW